MKHDIQLDELQMYKFENLTLKQKLLEVQMAELQSQQEGLVKTLYPEFQGGHKCAVNFKDKILTIMDQDEAMKNGSLVM
jgi:hypothetical protein